MKKCNALTFKDFNGKIELLVVMVAKTALQLN